MGYLVLPLLNKGIIHLFIYKVRAREEHEKEGSQFFLHPSYSRLFSRAGHAWLLTTPPKGQKGKIDIKTPKDRKRIWGKT